MVGLGASMTRNTTLNDRLPRVYQIVFWIACAAIFIVCAWRLWDLRLLYANATYRSYIQNGMTSISDARGWPLSDISIRAVYDDRVRLIHRVHRKGPDDTDCLDAIFESDALPPCND
jgi:hypothetical protein